LEEPTEENLERFADAEEQFRLLDGYGFMARAEAVLQGLQLNAAANTARLSGGQQRRVMLAAQLLAPGDLLLLDEPTNHLDAASLEWLEQWVTGNPATILLVSHDRAFLDATVTSVAELERGVLSVWPGNYSQALELKATARAAQQRLYDAQQRSKRALDSEISRLGSQARSAGKFNQRRAGNQALILAKAKAENVSRTLAKRAQALERRAAQTEEAGKPFDDRTVLQVPLPEVPTGPTEVLRIEDLTLQRGGRTLLQDFSLVLRRGEKLALLGPNGSGKSSLLQAILGQLQPQQGSITPGSGLSVFHSSQHGAELQAYVTLGNAILDAQPELRRQDLFSLLAQLGLPADPGFLVADLSGGQLTRLALARLAVTRASLLLLDEPTNHLDLRMVEALESTLVSYPGTILFASHDRRLVQAVATRRLNLGSVS
jgi:ATP-binding cassette subfamily F protein 3